MRSDITINKDTKKLHIRYLLIFLVIIVVVALLLNMGAKNDVTETASETVVESLGTTVVDIADKISKHPSKHINKAEALTNMTKNDTYEVSLFRDPEVTLWELTRSVEERNAAHIGELTYPKAEKLNCEIVLLKESALIEDDCKYYLCIKGVNEEEYVGFQVTEETIDEGWDALLLDIANWNNLIRPHDINSVWDTKTQGLSAYLKKNSDGYVIKDIPPMHFVVDGELLTPNE